MVIENGWLKNLKRIRVKILDKLESLRISMFQNGVWEEKHFVRESIVQQDFIPKQLNVDVPLIAVY